MKSIKLFILSMLFFTGVSLVAGIVNTKHNLSATNTAGTVKAVSETEVCVFCHLPHETQSAGKPLWNRSMPTSNYTMYDSNYLRRLSYPSVALDLGASNDTPGALSRQCLSCHDGTVAIGSVMKLRSGGYNTLIPMSGTDADMMPTSVPDGTKPLLGTDLSVHHPVGIEYDTTVSKNFDIGSRTSEFLDPPTSPIKLFEYSSYPGKKYVECTSCHDPHVENNKFLRVTAGATLAEDIVLTCTSCHSKEVGGAPNPHKVLGDSYTDGTASKYGTAVLAKLFCINCHTPHGAQSGQAYLQRKVEQNTCFMGASADRTTAPCHGTGSILERIDIESILDRQYSHGMVKSVDGVHTNLDTLYGTGVSRYPSGTKGLSFSDSQHVECVDCHNPHKVGASPHVADSEIYPTTPTNNVSDVLRGVNGVEPSWPSAWTQPKTFSTMETATKEYQICFKCHSYWGLGDSISLDNPSSNYPSVSEPATIPLTDVAWEMNKNNKSGHPVVVSATSRTGSYSPQAIPAAALLAPWDANPGGNTMYCSDCHGADDELNVVDPKGPHGSTKKFMLKSATGNYYWPFKSDGVTAYDTNDIGTTGSNGLFCKNCHDLNQPHKNDWNSWMRSRNYQCINCHVAIPHGSPVSRLIGYSTFPAPYDYGNASLRITRYIKDSVVSSNDIAGTSCGGGMCHGGNSVPGYDPYPVP